MLTVTPLLWAALSPAFLAVAITLAAAIAAAAVHPPLVPVGELSILGRRLVWVAGFFVGVGVLLWSTHFEVLFAEGLPTIGSGESDVEVFLSIALCVGLELGLIWLGIDLLRLGRRRRWGSLDAAIHRIGVPRGRARRVVRRVLRVALASSLWVAVALFAAFPLVVLLGLAG